MSRLQRDAIVICLDVGPGMVQSPPEIDSPLESSVKIIKNLLQRKIFSESKDEIALVLFGTEETLNELADETDESYKNITVLQQLRIPDFELLENVSNIEPGPEETDFLDAVTVGLDILHKQTQGKKIECRRLVLFTSFDHQFSDDNLDGIIRGFQFEGEEVQLNVIAPEFEEPVSSDAECDSGSDGEGPSVKRHKYDDYKGKPKTPQQRAGEKLITQLLQQGVDGCTYSYNQAVLALTGFEKKSVRSTAWKCHLTLGTELSIPCAAYAKAKEDKLKKSWTKCYAKTNDSQDIRKEKYFFLSDKDQTEVDEGHVSKGYRYGKDVIPFSKEDENQMKYMTDGKCLSILGFTDVKNVKAQDLMDDQAHLIFTEKGHETAAAALSALVTALDNQKMCAIARYVFRKGLNPKIVVLFPRVTSSYRCLVMVALPFAEDLRPLEFPALESAKNATPSTEQLSAVDALIDSMDLCKGDELFHPRKMPNPFFQRVYHNLNYRALNPKDPLIPPDNSIKNILATNEVVLQRSKSAAVRLAGCFKLVKEEVKQKKLTGVETFGNTLVTSVKKEVNNDLAAGDAPTTSFILSETPQEVQSVGSVTPDQDFISLLKKRNDCAVRTIFEQMQQRILEFIFDSFTMDCNSKVILCLLLMKEKASERGQVDLYNSFLRDLKNTLLSDSSKMQYWDAMVSQNITLLEGDGVTAADIAAFLARNASDDSNAQDGKTDIDDLLDEL